MFVLIWTSLLLCMSGSSARAGASMGGTTICHKGFCITLSEGEITAEAGLCVVIPCSFNTSQYFTPQHMVWYKCKQKCGDSDVIFQTNKNNNIVQPAFRGPVSLLEPDVSQRNCSIIINDLMESDSGLYQFRVNGVLWNGKQDGFTFSPRANVSVKDLTQKPTVMIPPVTEGQQTTLTCTAPGFCSGSAPEITWTWSGARENDSHITGNITDNQRHSSTLTFNPSAMHHDTNVTCKVSFTNNITTEETVTLNVTLLPRILNSSACVVQSEVLTCVCISEGAPVPTIQWPLLENHTEYSVTTNVSNHTVNASITVSVKDRNYTTVRCVSSNHIGEAKEDLMIITQEELKQEQDLLKKLLIIVQQPEVITAFLTGILLSATICCLATICCRKKQKSSENVATETLEMVTTQAVPLIDAAKVVENDATQEQEAAEEAADAPLQSAPDGDVEPKEVEYSNIDFSVLKRKSPTGAEETEETTETEYAEIKKEGTEERQDSAGEEGDMLEGDEEDEETKQCVPEKEEGEDMAVYSTVNDVMDEI